MINNLGICLGIEVKQRQSNSNAILIIWNSYHSRGQAESNATSAMPSATRQWTTFDGFEISARIIHTFRVGEFLIGRLSDRNTSVAECVCAVALARIDIVNKTIVTVKYRFAHRDLCAQLCWNCFFGFRELFLRWFCVVLFCSVHLFLVAHRFGGFADHRSSDDLNRLLNTNKNPRIECLTEIIEIYNNSNQN